MPHIRVLGACAVVLVASAGQAADATCTTSPSQVSLTRRLRQLSLDLLGRPPTVAEYRAAQEKGEVSEADVRALMETDEFYARAKGYHRALLRSNISNSIFVDGDTRLQVTTDGFAPLEIRGTPSSGLRGRNNTGCDHFVQQDDCNATAQDPHLEPPTKACRDSYGVPLPVSVDYSPDQYACTRLDTNAARLDCATALAAGKYAAKYAYFCDMRRLADGALAPHLCLPNPAQPVTAALATEVLDADSRVVAFVNPSAPPNQLARLDRCSLDLQLTGGVRGRYQPQRGCIQREGVVTVATPPFWTPAAGPTAMCAIEAQARAVNPWTMETCETRRFHTDRTCGCGLAARRCEPANGTVHAARLAAINEEPLRIADSVVRRDEDYFTLLTTRRGFVNGPLSQLFRERQSPSLWLVSAPTRPELVPDVPLAEQDTWVEYTRDEQAAGVLTSVSWLYRFPTQRARVNHFWQAFLCKHFTPPAGAVVPPPGDSCNRDNNLATRCGCSYCHATIEPTGAHWGRFGERNAQYLDPAAFPRVSAKCRDCALSGNTTCDNECGNYVMQAFDGEGAASLGLLRTYLYRTPEEEPNIVAGPKLLVERMLQTGDLERCAVRNAWNHLLGRPMTGEEERLYLEGLVDDFAAHHHSFKHLLLRIVSTDAYRRVD